MHYNFRARDQTFSLALRDERLGLLHIGEEHGELVLGEGRHAIGGQVALQRVHRYVEAPCAQLSRAAAPRIP